MNIQHPDLSVQDYSLLIDSIDWELDFLNMPDGKTAVVRSSSAPSNAVSSPFLINMTTIRTDDPRDLLPSEYEDPWPRQKLKLK